MVAYEACSRDDFKLQNLSLTHVFDESRVLVLMPKRTETGWCGSLNLLLLKSMKMLADSVEDIRLC